MVILCSKWLYSVRSGFIFFLFRMIYPATATATAPATIQKRTECISLHLLLIFFSFLFMPRPVKCLSSFVMRFAHMPRQWFIWSQIASTHKIYLKLFESLFGFSFSFFDADFREIRFWAPAECYTLDLRFPLNKSTRARLTEFFFFYLEFVCVSFAFMCVLEAQGISIESLHFFFIAITKST